MNRVETEFDKQLAFIFINKLTKKKHDLYNNIVFTCTISSE